MKHLITSVEMRRSRGRIVLQCMGLSSRGQKFLVKEVHLVSKDLISQALKVELEAEVSKLLSGQEAPEESPANIPNTGG